ncbi:MAG TPA: dipeptidase PepV [Desulfobacteria bacterium]|nr:dipeptidase PepV [Desulfobacteria bacterium]
MNYDGLVQKYESPLLKDLKELIRIPSVRDEATVGAGAPFGKGPADALKWYLAKAADMGFRVKNVDGYAGHVEYGEGDELIGVLVHLDVVPPGTGWESEPFEAVLKDGKVFGRGAIDNKGPALTILYALKAVKDSGLPLGKRIRIIAGCDEECGMSCVDYYLKHEENPTIGFSPDAEFPLIHAEKGIAQFKVTWKAATKGLMLSGGARPNVVPQVAEALLSPKGSAENWTEFAQNLQNSGSRLPNARIEVSREENKLKLTAYGKAAHGSTPQKGINAIISLLETIASSQTLDDQLQFLLTATKGLNGEGIDLALTDEVSGKLTINLGMIKLSEGKGEASIDIRCPVTYNLDQVWEQVRTKFEQAGFGVEILSFQRSHYVPKDSPLVRTLVNIYRDFTGDKREAIAIGGGTYARMVKGAVAFGPTLPGRDEVAHMANEYILLDDIRVSLKIYTKALLELAK